MSPVDASHRELLRVLTDHGVDFVLVGGVALQVVELLGTRPTDRRARGLWDHGADLIRAYRERWDIPADACDSLGEPPIDDARRADRTALERQLARTVRLLSRVGHGPDREPHRD